MGRDADDEGSRSERTAGREVTGNAVDVERAGATWEEGASEVTCTDDEEAGYAARRPWVLRSAGLVGVGMAAEKIEGVKETNSTRKLGKDGEA